MLHYTYENCDVRKYRVKQCTASFSYSFTYRDRCGFPPRKLIASSKQNGRCKTKVKKEHLFARLHHHTINTNDFWTVHPSSHQESSWSLLLGRILPLWRQTEIQGPLISNQYSKYTEAIRKNNNNRVLQELTDSAFIWQRMACNYKAIKPLNP